MATIKERTERFTCIVRYKGVSITQTFSGPKAAARWGRDVESAIDLRQWPRRDLVPVHLWSKYGLAEATPKPVDDTRPHVGWTLDKALSQYKTTVSDHTKGWKQAGDRIAAWRARPVAERRLDDPELPRELQSHIGARLAAGRAANTVRNEIFLISAVFEFARAADVDGTGKHGWGLSDLDNPCRALVLPPPPQHRNRRLQDGDGERQLAEEDRLHAALAAGPDGEAMAALFTLAVESGMRLSELLDVRRGQIQSAGGTRYIHRPDSKSGRSRRVVLSTRAAVAIDALLAALPSDGAADDDRLFALDVPAVEHRWRLGRKAAGVTGLRWHDLRHEALSRMAEKGLTIGELQAQSGHRTAQVLLGYVNARPSEVAKKLG